MDDRANLRPSPEALSNLGHLSGGVGHHVINAFSAIVSNAEVYRILAESGTAQDPIALADLIIKTSIEASGVARRLIDYTRTATAVGSGHVALDRLAAEVVEAARAEGPPGVAWETEFEALPPIIGNDLQLIAMIRHLIANALEALPPGGGTITVATGRDQRGWILLEVRDSGEGMDATTLERALEPFFTTKADRQGVGLSIAHGIWRRHRGTMGLRSRPGEGTSIRLSVDPENVGVPGTAPA